MHTLEAVYAKEAHDDSLLNHALQSVKSLYKGPVENPEQEMEEASKYVDLMARIRKHDDATVEAIKQMTNVQDNQKSESTIDSQEPLPTKGSEVIRNISLLCRDEVFLWTTVRFLLFMIAMLTGSMVCFYFFYYHTPYFNDSNKLNNAENYHPSNSKSNGHEIKGTTTEF